MAHILVIDDEPLIVAMLTAFLERDGHRIVSAQNGREGLDKLDRGEFDIIMTDIFMPECDGIEFLMATRDMAKRPKIIAMSGGSAHSDDRYVLKLAKLISADAVFSKPLEVSSLGDKIRELLHAPHS